MSLNLLVGIKTICECLTVVSGFVGTGVMLILVIDMFGFVREFWHQLVFVSLKSG